MSTYPSNQNQQRKEAIAAGERALCSLREAKRSLSSASSWGLFDIFAGGVVTSLVKHGRIDEARDAINAAKHDLESFSTELGDVRDMRDLDIDIDGLLSAFDIFFDNALTDILVQQRISQATKAVDNAVHRVEKILQTLKSDK